jgi:uncharacterized protein YciI
MTEIAPIRREVEVRASVDTAFALFTSHLGAWWPLQRHSVYGDAAVVAFEGERVVERFGDQTSVWAEVVGWDPPTSLRLAWHPGSDAEEATDVSVTFTADGDRTLVTLVHSGWEAVSEPAATAEEYGKGWPGVLAEFAAKVATSTPPDDASAPEEASWFALRHTPGPALSDGASIFASPMFGEHLAFLERLRVRGLLIAAGPIVPERGEGMAIVRVPAALASDVDLVELATKDDLCVAGGYLEVEVKPWSVRVTG